MMSAKLIKSVKHSINLGVSGDLVAAPSLITYNVSVTVSPG